MVLEDLARDDPTKDDAESYREECVKSFATEHFPPRFQTLHAAKRNKRMMWLLRWFLAYQEEGWRFSYCKQEAIKQAAEETEASPSNLYDEIREIYKDRAEGENVQSAFERDLRSFLDSYRSAESNC
jgi:hypothetical protein